MKEETEANKIKQRKMFEKGGDEWRGESPNADQN